MDLVSVVIPIYNMGDKIKNCVYSITHQTYTNIEIFLIDDGSIDDSLCVCKALQEEDSRINVVHTDNQGSGPARNEGIKRASGKYIYFPDADDYVEPEAIQVLVDLLNSTSSDLVVFGFRNVDTNGNLIYEKTYQDYTIDAQSVRMNYAEYYKMSGHSTIQGAPWNKIFSLDVIKCNGIQFPPLRRHQDEAFIARYVDKAEKIVFSSDVFYTYYVNDLQRQWDKYPINYIDAAEGLFADRQKNILKWNLDDEETKRVAYNEYSCCFVKSLELAFSPKYGFDRKRRMQWIKNSYENSAFKLLKGITGVSKYHAAVGFFIRAEHWQIGYYLLWLKVKFEQLRSHWS